MVKNASAGEKAGWSNGRTPLFSQKDLLRLVGPLLIEQFLAVTVGMADTRLAAAGDHHGVGHAHRHFQQLLHQQRNGQHQQFLLAEQRLPPAGQAAFFIAMQ